MSISEVIKKRNISEVVHFTTNSGLIGILSLKSLKSRSLLSQEESLEYILNLNSRYRSDPEWINYVNLSLTDINKFFFSLCKNKKTDGFWCILCFSAEILTHSGLFFTTTNNIYPSVIRGSGSTGLEAMFKDSVKGRYGSIMRRSASNQDNQTTDIQAEVLYPNELDIIHLTRVIAPTDEDADDIYGIMHSLNITDITVDIDPNAFR